jgi:hypothetical protein
VLSGGHSVATEGTYSQVLGELPSRGERAHLHRLGRYDHPSDVARDGPAGRHVQGDTCSLVPTSLTQSTSCACAGTRARARVRAWPCLCVFAHAHVCVRGMLGRCSRSRTSAMCSSLARATAPSGYGTSTRVRSPRATSLVRSVRVTGTSSTVPVRPSTALVRPPSSPGWYCSSTAAGTARSTDL